jgi:very-short-patch-repair endonuclease/predicted transcriptional regulator of viral defense system
MTDVMRLTHRIGALIASRGEKLARLASIQHGVVGTWQLLILGYTSRQIARNVASGRLHRLHRGVYAVGHTRLTRKARWMAAVLSCGPDAVLSHRAAAALHGLRPAPKGGIDVTVCGGNRSRPGIYVHNVRKLDPADCTMIDGIPITTLERTLLDYAEVAGEQWTRLAIEAAQRQDRLDLEPYRTMLARNPGRHGRIPLLAAMSQVSDEAPWTQSEPERRLLAGLRARGLPEPSTNVLVQGELVDFHWQRERLVVEVDGDFWHKTPAAREANRRRDVKLQLGGQMVARFSDHLVMRELNRALDEIEALLARRRRETAG